MQDLKTVLQYSNSSEPKVINSNSTVEPTTVLRNLTDLIPDDGYAGFYINKLRSLGYEKFMELAQKARAGSDTPQRLFCWMLKNPDLVK